MDDEGRPRSLLETFPIVEKQHEALSALKPVILRRATAELRVWDSAPLVRSQRPPYSITLLTFLSNRTPPKLSLPPSSFKTRHSL